MFLILLNTRLVLYAYPMANYDIIQKGRAAKELLESEVFRSVLEELKKDTFETWTRSKPADRDAREDLYYLQLSLAYIKTKLIAMTDNGRLEQEKSEREDARQQVTAAQSAGE